MSHAATAGEIEIVPLEEDKENHATQTNPPHVTALPRPGGRAGITVWGYSIAVGVSSPRSIVPCLFSWTASAHS